MTLAFWPRRLRQETATSRFRRAPHVLATAQGGELVLFDTRGERYYTLNEVGSRIWALLAEATSPDEIVDQLRAEYAMPAGVPGDSIAQDVARLLDELHSAHLVSAERAHHGR